MNDLGSQQTKAGSLEKKALLSLIFGLLSLFPELLFICWLSAGKSLTGPIGETIEEKFALFSLAGALFIASYALPLLLLFSIMGIILGKIGLKSTKRRLAVWGIALSTISLIFHSLALLGFLAYFLF